jgi:hypothetical protein
MTSRDATDAPCKGCPDAIPPGYTKPEGAPRNWTPDGLPDGLPECTSKGSLIDTDEVTYSKSWGIYTGGTPEMHFSTLALTIPKDFSRVTVDQDGCIEYKKGQDGWEPPRPIDGYERDPENKWFFRPTWESCQWRHYGVAVLAKCQCLDVIARCSLNGCFVKSTECSECGARIEIRPRQKPVKKTIQSLRLPDLDRSSK